MKVSKIDASATSVVAVCLVCPWRSIADDRLTALRQYRHHELRAHPGQRGGLDTLRQYVKRHGLSETFVV